MPNFKDAQWYEMRPAANRKPATYTCPICRRHLAALEPHTLVLPDGDASRRRHAHTACVLRERAGRLPLREDVFPKPPSLFGRLFGRG